MLDEERARIMAEVLTEMRASNRYYEQDFKNKYPPTTPGEERDLNLLLWEARELLRTNEGIDFGPLKGWPGHYERKDWKQTELRAHRQRAKGTRAHKRAEGKLRLAASKAPDENKERINDAADRLALRVAMQRKPLPHP